MKREQKYEYNMFILVSGIAIIFFVIILSFSLIMSDENELQVNEFGESYEADTLMACIMAQDFVKSKLKAPSTAEFQMCYKATTTYQGSQNYYTTGYVDSQNGFGAMLRTEYTVKIVDNQDGYWSLKDIDVN